MPVSASRREEITALATEAVNAVNDALREEFRDRWYLFRSKQQKVSEVKP